jgi:hypothetical protein
MTKKRTSLLKRLPQLAELAMQGSLAEVFLTCGTKTCGCHSDPARRHGPHLYLKFKDSAGKQTSLYVPRSHEREIRKVAEAWREHWETIVALSDLNREELRERLRQRKDAAQ